MAIAGLVLILLVLVLAHETAHALALRGFGIPIVEAGLGFGKPKLTIKPRGRLRIALTISPWLAGAYVKHDPARHKDLEALGYHKIAWFCNAGIVINLIIGAGLAAIAGAMKGNWIHAAVAAAVGVALWLFRRAIAAYILPALAIPALVLIGWGLAIAWSQGQTGLGFAGIGAFAPHSAVDAVTVAAVFSIGLAILNSIPLGPFDNGTVVGLLIQWKIGHRVEAAYHRVGNAVMWVAIVAAVGSDLWAIVR